MRVVTGRLRREGELKSIENYVGFAFSKFIPTPLVGSRFSLFLGLKLAQVREEITQLPRARADLSAGFDLMERGCGTLIAGVGLRGWPAIFQSTLRRKGLFCGLGFL